MASFFVRPQPTQNASKIKMLASNSLKFDGKLTDDDSGPDSPLHKLTMADMEQYKMLWRGSGRWNHSSLATFFNIQISGLPNRFLLEIEENVNSGRGKRRFLKIPFEYRKNMQSQIVVCYSRDQNATPIS